MTVVGAQKLREELARRKQVDRPRIVAAIAEARAHGDLKENAEYHAAREMQGFNEGRIQEIEAKLAAAEIIDITTVAADGRVVFGSTVDIVNCETDKRVTYQIVGEDEADIRAGRVCVTSPVARALIGKTSGDVVTVKAPGGIINYEILEVKYI